MFNISVTDQTNRVKYNLTYQGLYFYFFAFLAISYYYLGPFRTISLGLYGVSLLYLCIVYFHSLRINRWLFVSVNLLLALICIDIFIFQSYYNLFLSIRLFYGFLLFFFFLYYIDLPKPKPLIIFLSVLTILEYLFLKIYPDIIFQLPNYDQGKSFYVSHASSWLGGVHSFGGSRTVSGVLLLALHIYSKQILKCKKTEFLSLIAMFVCVSGTAYGLYFLFLLSTFYQRFVRLKPSAILGLVAIMVLLGVFFYTGDKKYFFQQFSFRYFYFVFSLKFSQILELLEIGNLWFGNGSFLANADSDISGYDVMFGDFILLELIRRHGLLGLGVLLFALFGLAKKQVRFPIFIILLGTLHYHVIFSGPGQFLTAWLLSLGLKYKAMESPKG